MARYEPELADSVRRKLARGGRVVVTGGRGAGRSRALRRLATSLPSAWRQVRVTAGAPASGVRHEFGRGHPDRVVVVADDLHRLSSEVRAAVGLAAEGGAALLASTTTEAAVPDDVRALLLAAVTVEPPPLTDVQLSRLVAARLGAAPDRVGLAQLARATGRRPGLLLRVLDGLSVEADGDVALLPNDVATSAGALAWRRERLGDPALHQLARLLERGEDLRRDQVASVVGAATVERAIGEGLVRIDEDRAVLCDPLLAAVTRGPDRVTHGPSDAAALLVSVAGGVTAAVGDRWAVEAGQDVVPRLAGDVAHRVLLDGQPRLALRLVGDGHETPDLALVRARVLAAVGRAEEAARLLEYLLEVADGAVMARAAVRLADHRFFRGLDPHGALSVLDRVEPAGDPIEQEADGLRALIGSALGLESPGQGQSQPPAAVRLVTDLRAALAGRVSGVDDVTLLPAEASPAGLPLRARSRTNRTLAALHGAGVRAAHDAVQEEIDAAVASGRPGALALALGMCGVIEQLEGRLELAERTLRAAGLRAAVDDEAGLPDLLRAQRAVVLAELGDLDRAAQVHPGGPMAAPADLRVRLVGSGARVRVLAATDLDAAAAVALEDIEVGVGTGHQVWAVLAGLHAARAGLAEDVADAVSLAAHGTVGLAPVAAAAVRAFASDERTEHRQASSAMAEYGLRRIAAELLLRPQATTDDRKLAGALLAGLGPPRPDHAVQVEELTARERQVAHLVSQGRTSRAVAELLGLSVRTVENHLRKVYRKLGIKGRDDLATVLGAGE